MNYANDVCLFVVQCWCERSLARWGRHQRWTRQSHWKT